MNRITMTTGTEGPRHDPYGYTELTFTLRNGVPVMLHEGLGTWLQVGESRHTMDAEAARVGFYYLTGYAATECERFLRKAEEARYRQHKAHGGYEWHSGYPGEAFCVCKCGQHVDYTFNEAAIL